MIVQSVKSLVERLLALGAEIALATIGICSVFVSARMTAEPTFHRSCLQVERHLLYCTHYILTHYRWDLGHSIQHDEQSGGYETMNMMQKGQIENVEKGVVRKRVDFIHQIFAVGA